MLPGLMTWRRDPYTWRRQGSDDQEPRGGLVGSYLRLLLMFAITQGITSVLLVSVFRSKLVAGTPLVYELTTRSIAQLTHVPVYAFLALAILKALSETELYERLLRARK